MSKDLPGRILERNDNMRMGSAIIRCGQEGALELGTACLALFQPLSSHKVWEDCGTQGYAHAKPTSPRMLWVLLAQNSLLKSLLPEPVWISSMGLLPGAGPAIDAQCLDPRGVCWRVYGWSLDTGTGVHTHG